VRRAAAISILALATALAALSPVAATAADAGPTAPLRGTPELFLQAPGGYRIGVSERLGAVALTVVRKHGKHGAAATTYAARGTATPSLLQASFGRFGRISMRFRRSAAKPRLAPHGHCHGPGTLLVQRGVFVGRLRFRGEDGYVSVDVHRAGGRISHLATHCLRHVHLRHRRNLFRPSQGGSSEREVAYLAARSKAATASEAFVALKLKEKVAFIAMASDDAGKVSRFHVALALGRPRAFALNDALTGGRVTPGGPFAGSATYGAAPDGSSSWEGLLSVNFPGAPRFPLTGPPLQTSVGTLPALFVLFLLKHASAGDALALAATEKPSLFAGLGPAPR
jgi:hypothetical protein